MVLGAGREPIMRLQASTLHSVRKDRLLRQFRQGLKAGLGERERILDRAARLGLKPPASVRTV